MKLVHSKIIIGLGIWLVILPFTGFPGSWIYCIINTGNGKMGFPKKSKPFRHNGDTFLFILRFFYLF